jgi:hypothetical protein
MMVNIIGAARFMDSEAEKLSFFLSKIYEDVQELNVKTLKLDNFPGLEIKMNLHSTLWDGQMEHFIKGIKAAGMNACPAVCQHVSMVIPAPPSPDLPPRQAAMQLKALAETGPPTWNVAKANKILYKAQTNKDLDGFSVLNLHLQEKRLLLGVQNCTPLFDVQFLLLDLCHWKINILNCWALKLLCVMITHINWVVSGAKTNACTKKQREKLKKLYILRLQSSPT